MQQQVSVVVWEVEPSHWWSGSKTVSRVGFWSWNWPGRDWKFVYKNAPNRQQWLGLLLAGDIHNKALMCLFLRMGLWNVQSTPPLRRRRGAAVPKRMVPPDVGPYLMFWRQPRGKQAYATINDTSFKCLQWYFGQGSCLNNEETQFGDLVGHKTKKQHRHKSKRLTFDDTNTKKAHWCILMTPN